MSDPDEELANNLEAIAGAKENFSEDGEYYTTFVLCMVIALQTRKTFLFEFHFAQNRAEHY